MLISIDALRLAIGCVLEIILLHVLQSSTQVHQIAELEPLLRLIKQWFVLLICMVFASWEFAEQTE